MGNIKRYIRFLLVAAVMIGSLSLAGCGDKKQETDKKTETAEKQQDSKKNAKEETGEIPKELLPGQNAKEEGGAQEHDDAIENGDATANGAAAKSKAVYHAGGSDSSGGNASKEQSGAGTDFGGSDDKGGSTIAVAFDAESSAAESYGYSVYYSASVTLPKGATVYNALEKALKEGGISYSGSSYISSIGGLAEKACGSLSGWKYYVNGVEAKTACTDYTLTDGDTVQWSYVLEP